MEVRALVRRDAYYDAVVLMRVSDEVKRMPGVEDAAGLLATDLNRWPPRAPFLRVRCADCHAEELVAFSYKRRGLCPSCGARRMAESAALLAEAHIVLDPVDFVARLAALVPPPRAQIPCGKVEEGER